jgi:hypothetical protein
MKVRLRIAALLAVLAIAATGCQSNLFSECDQRPSLADWFDCYGCTGCYCRDGGCCPSGNGGEYGRQCAHHGDDPNCGCPSR